MKRNDHRLFGGRFFVLMEFGKYTSLKFMTIFFFK
jgi:hypothetical protein